MSATGSYWLVGLEGKTRKVRVQVSVPILIGRGTSNHVVLDEPRVSRQHARLVVEREGCFIYDLNSSNGTCVNGVPTKRQLLAPNDILTFGPCVCRLELVPGAQPAATERLASEEPTLTGTWDEPGPESASQIVSTVEARDAAVYMPARDLRQLEDAHKNLGTLYSFMQAITKTIDRSELLHLAAAKILEIYPAASHVSVLLRGPEGGKAEALRLAHIVGPRIPPEPPALPERVSEAVLDRRAAILTSQSISASRGGADMYVPMFDRDEVLGVLHVSAGDQGDIFSHADLDLLKGMAVPAAVMLQNTRMHDDSLVEARFRHDLALAARIQKSFLPREVVAVEGLELFAEYRAAYTVSGDFYDVFWVAPDRLAVFIGDISGKGIAGALLMARISSELRIMALAHVDPVSVLTAMNIATLQRGDPEFFFTAIYLTLDVKTGDIVLANAGHPTPYVCQADGLVPAITGGAACPVGILDDPGYTSTTFNLGHGDTLVLYTDGVIEAANAEGTLYGDERMHASLFGPQVRPSVIAENILRCVDLHAAGGPVNDDLTLFLCQRSIGAAPTMQPRRFSSVGSDLPMLPPHREG